ALGERKSRSMCAGWLALQKDGVRSRPARGGETRSRASRLLDDQLLHRHAVAPLSHEALLRGVAERVLAMGAVEGRVGETIEELPGAVEVEGVDAARPHAMGPSSDVT